MKTQNSKLRTKSIIRMLSVEKLIANKSMLVDTANFHVAMLGELWNLYHDEGKIHLCRNILNYCHVKNSFDQLPPKENPVLLISLKDTDGNVAPYAYFRNGEIELIQDREAMVDPLNKTVLPFMKTIGKFAFRATLIILAVLVFIWVMAYTRK